MIRCANTGLLWEYVGDALFIMIGVTVLRMFIIDLLIYTDPSCTKRVLWQLQ